MNSRLLFPVACVLAAILGGFTTAVLFTAQKPTEYNGPQPTPTPEPPRLPPGAKDLQSADRVSAADVHLMVREPDAEWGAAVPVEPVHRPAIFQLAQAPLPPRARFPQPPAILPAPPGLPVGNPGEAPALGGPALPGPGLPGFDARARAEFDDLTPEERVAVYVYENVNKCVVNINTKVSRREGFFQLDIPAEGAGSGSMLDKAGHILTNYHVVEGAREILVTTHDGKSHDATLVGADPPNDVAVIKIDPAGDEMFPVTFGDSGRMKVGMRVFAIGNPFGLERTLTTGIVSSLNRSLKIRENRTIKSIIQIDAAINPGSSGGPLLDSRGHLIGMNTAIASKTGQNSGVGFAIPSNLISRLVSELIQRGRVVRPEIGIRHVYPTSKGLLIASLTPSGPAEQAGLRGPAVVRKRRGAFTYETIDRAAADLIVGVDQQPIKTVEDFLEKIESKRPGESVDVTVLRDGQPQTFTVRLIESEP